MPGPRVGYNVPMSRFAPNQPDLFAPAAVPPEAPSPGRPPLEELTALLADLRAADRLPWPDVSVAMVEEQRMLALARSAGTEGRALSVAIMDQIERLFAAAEQEAVNASAPSAQQVD
jgi:hypothetical protein